MSKYPAFLFYPGDWLGGTIGMSFEEKGAYIDLLVLQFNRGHMTSHMIAQTVGQIWESLQSKFEKDKEGLWFNRRLDIEKEKRQAYTNSRKNNILGVNQYTKKNTEKQIENVGHMNGHMNGHMTSHMEDIYNSSSSTLNNSINNIRTEKSKKIIIPKIEEVEDYFTKNDFPIELAKRFFESYSVADWKDSHGKQVKNWKQKAQMVWFKEENKIKYSKNIFSSEPESKTAKMLREIEESTLQAVARIEAEELLNQQP